jgi:ribose transport system permease protein
MAGFLVAMVVAFQMLNPKFLGERNIPILLRQISPFIIAGIGQSYVLLTGNIDLSIGSVIGMSCMASATLMSVKGIDPLLASILAIALSLIVGLANGLLVSSCKLPPFIATLGTMTIARGIAQLVNNGKNTGPITKPLSATDAAQIEAFAQKAQKFASFFYYGKFGPLYYSLFIAIGIWAVFDFILSNTATGRHIYAVGSNAEAARMSGVNVEATVIKAYVISSFCAGIIGLIQCAQSGQGSMNAGTSYELYAVAASVIGGISTLGGQGILIGTVIGASIWAALANGLSLAKVPLALQNIIVGIIVIISVLSDVVIRRRHD